MPSKYQHYYNYAAAGLISADALGSMSNVWRMFTPSTDEYVEHALFLHDELKSETAKMLRVSVRDIGVCQSTCQGIGFILSSLAMKENATVGLFQDEYANVDIVVRNIAQHKKLDLVELSRNVHLWPKKKFDVLVLSHVSYLNGVITNIEEICEQYSEAIIILDCAQSVGNVSWKDVPRKNVFIVYPGYKWLSGPFGMAFIVVPENFEEIESSPPALSHFGIDLSVYQKNKSIKYAAGGSIYESSTFCMPLYVGMLHQVKMYNCDSDSRTSTSRDSAKYISDIFNNYGYESFCAINKIESGIVSFTFEKTILNKVFQNFKDKGIICMPLRQYNLIRFCFIGTESEGHLVELGEIVHEALQKHR